MSGWTSNELREVGDAEELQIATQRPDGSLRDPVTIWVIRLGDDIYIRAINGPDGTWYRHSRDRKAGRIAAGGVTRDVMFTDADPGLHAEIDQAFRGKYHQYGPNIVGTLISAKAQAATIKLEPAA